VTAVEVAQIASGLAQVVVAGIAIVYARRAAMAGADGAKATHDSVWVASAIRSLEDVITRAREVRVAYRSMFQKFPTVKEKQAARTRWLTKREEVSALLTDLAELLPEISPVVVAWAAVDKEEDTFATTDALPVPDPRSVDAAHKRYEEVHLAFMRSMGTTLKKL
jgi:hypothetical protein